jgi:hypothetical protein
MIWSAWSRVSTGRVVSSSHSRVSFQTRTPRTRIGARPAGAWRGGSSSSSRQAAQTDTAPCFVRTVAAPIARVARSAASDPPPGARRRSCAARTTASQPVSRTLSRCSPGARQVLEGIGAALGDRDEEGARRRPADGRDRVGPHRRLPGLSRHPLGRPRPDRLVGQAQRLARGQHGQAAVRQEPGAAIVADPAGAPQPPMAREIQRRVVMHHQHEPDAAPLWPGTAPDAAP